MNPLSILLAEDEVLTRMDIKEMLQAAGHLVCGETNNGVKAVELAKKLAPDLAILDIKMPGLDGIEVAKILQTMSIPVILLTAYSQVNYINRAEKVSVYGYLVKPVMEQDLLPAVQIAYARYREMQSMQTELEKTRIKLQSQSLIAHAKAILIARCHMDDLEAHQYLIHEAMNRRVGVVELSQSIVDDDRDNFIPAEQ